jgi:short-subunit dehydrogenase
MLLAVWSFIQWAVTILLVLPFFGYLLTNFSWAIFGSQNLKKKYNATWGLVTGSSSGIGKEVAIKLASQGINVVLVALGDATFDTTHEELKKAFPEREFRKVPCDLSDGTGSWMKDVVNATEDIDVQLLFNNAGYILTGFFHHRPVEVHLANFHCNLTATIHLTHHFYSKMLEKKLKGAIVFTSSAAGFIPNPFAVCYGLTKAAVSELACSLAVEARAKGIDVCAIHPSPVKSRFMEGGGNKVTVDKLEMFDAAYKMATGPEALPDKIFACVGRPCISVDLGGVAVGMRLMVMSLSYALLTFGFALFAPFMPDYKKHDK